MRKFLLHPLCGLICVIVLLALFKAASVTFYPPGSMEFFEANRPLEFITYGFYACALTLLLALSKDFEGSAGRFTWCALLLLAVFCFLREMGFQHWLTSHDTTALKISFFHNPTAPLHEKVIAGIIMVTVYGTALVLFAANLPRMVKGFFRGIPLYWTIATFGAAGILSQVCDRLPAKLLKYRGIELGDTALLWLKLFEEGLEATLPVLFMLALWQYRCSKRRRGMLTFRD